MSSNDPSPVTEGSAVAEASTEPAPVASQPAGSRVTRVGAVWVATASSLALLILLIVFILQNQTKVELSFLGFSGDVPVGVAMLIAAVFGGSLVAISGGARVIQLRRNLRRMKRRGPS